VPRRGSLAVVRWSRVLTVVDCHAEGEMGKVVTGGLGDVPGETVFDKRTYLIEHDELRRMLLFEPRGGAAHNANVIVPAGDPEASHGYVIMESTEYPVMSGSNTICVATVLLETGMVPMVEPVTELVLESPAGLIRVRCECRDGKVTSVRFTNQPALVYHLGATVEVEGLGSLGCDVSWGGMAYAIVDAADLGFALTPDEARDLCTVGERIKAAAAEQLDAVHPTYPQYAGITMTELAGPLRTEDGMLTSRNAVVVSPGRLDRSPCGTGTSARLAVMHARGQIGVGERFVHESVIGTRFDTRIESTTTVGEHVAVVPSVAGQAWITEISQVGLDPSDPFPAGYTLSDTWSRAVGAPID
jgi:proline racemase